MRWKPPMGSGDLRFTADTLCRRSGVVRAASDPGVRRPGLLSRWVSSLISWLVSSHHRPYCGDGNFRRSAAAEQRRRARQVGEEQMAFEFGMFHEFQCPAGKSQPDAFAESFAQVDAAERWGLDAMWLAEIHVAPERSVCAVPLTIASAIAARTSRIKIGTGVQVLPLCHPLRVGEEAATVDQISRGRLIFGVGRSGFPRTYEAYGVPYGESRERFAETLEILKRAWTEDPFSYSGK